ncbi:disulfide reductase [candidate division MSBL1 archaeon SCGC-AAA261F17]|uniref:CoB--CoM heterodisulfide reductase iron-sulfur subunit A n=1 Tax=candidate division MSBL1 archaeon SCGC-AAA261F17 TaxID=1698274 RepID=A0A133V6B8_9EURY|nr:disulfide reductase [candidate division MSBL1 archaeon SCGC-AAA261F17]
MSEKIGVYICHCGTNIAGTVDIKELTEFASGLEDVAVVKDYEFMCSDVGQRMIREDIKKENLTKVVVASCSPALHEATFMGAVEEGGLNRFEFQMANIREHCSWVTDDKTEATEKAKRMVKAAVSRVRRHEPLKVRKVEVTPRTLVIGAGIAGIEAALKVADSGKEVYLVEKSPSIGGHMAQLDKTFPTLDCSSCILTPKMEEVGSHPNINLLTYSEVESVAGFPGNFEVKIRKKAKYVDEDKCTGCGVCQERCPATAPSEFDERLGKRKAVYIPFPQAVPRVPVIDKDNCIYFKEGKCRACELNCPTDAIDFEQDDEVKEITVGNIIVATGYDLFDSSKIECYGYKKYDNVYTALEVERMLDATGPTGGEILLSDGSEPKTVAIIHCVGSRDENYHEYCSRVCCMYSMKLAHLIREETGAEVYELYLDLRAFGKGYEEFYRRVRESWVTFVKGGPAKVDEGENGKLLVKCEDSILGERITIPADMVVLSPAMEARSDSDKLVDILSLNKSKDGFFLERHPKLAPISTSSDGIFIAGACQGPKDIPDTIAQAAAAGVEAVSMMDAGFLELEPYLSEIDEELCCGCKTCISVCPYDAISFDEEKGVSVVEETLCRGCGICISACPSGAARQRGFTDEQLVAEILAII